VSGLSCATKNCVLSDGAISEKSFSANKSVSLYQLFPKKNEVKGVLSNGNLFSVKYWLCNHYGKHSFMIIGPEAHGIPDEFNNQVIFLASVSLSESEINLLAKSIEKSLLNYRICQ